MQVEVFPVKEVSGVMAADDGSAVDLRCAWGDGEVFMLRLPLPVATAMTLFLQNGCAEASRRGGDSVRPPIVNQMALQAFPVPGHEILTVEIEGGMNLQFLVKAGRFQKGIPRLP